MLLTSKGILVMKFFLKTLFFIFLFSFICLMPSSQAAIILKTKNKQALIHLEGIKTQRGSYFEVIDFYGQKKGVIQIKRVGEKKAIGVVKLGQIGKRWSLEPVSKKRAVAQITSQKRAAKIARIQKEKLKKKLALKKKRKALKRKLALKKKKSSGRSLASDEGNLEYILSDLPEEDSYQSQEVLSYKADTASESEESFSSEDDESHNVNSDANLYHEVPQGPSRISLGLSPRFEYNLMNISPGGNDPSYLMHGLGYGLFAYFDFSLNSFIRTELNLGFKQFSVDSKGENCGQREDCSLKINYIVASSNLKLNISKWDEHQFWGAFEGTLMYPVAFSNTTLITDHISGSSGTINGPHGTIGGALGLDFTFGKLVFPMSLRAGVYIPPTATIMTGTVGFQMGLAYKL